MRIYDLSKRDKESIYEYLYKSIKKDIINGVLAPNEKLPSKRNFANNQGISVVTVENTYEQLVAEGYIYSKPKSGFYVSPIETMDMQGEFISKDLRIKTTDNKSSMTEISKADSNAINLITNHTAIENFPFSVWAKIVRRILSEENENLLRVPQMGGVDELKEAIARHLYEFRGIICDKEQIIIGAGTEYLYGLIVQLLGRDRIYGLENPSSKKIKKIYEAQGVKMVHLSMDMEGILLSPENLTMPDVIQISPSHQFPLGIVMSVSRRYGLLQWANESSNRYIIEDDYDSEFRLQGKPIPSLFSMDTTDRVIYFNTFTKSLASTIRISYMVLPKPLLEKYKEKLGFYSCTVSNFDQYTLAAFINEGYFEKHLNRMRNQYRAMRDEIISELKNSSIANMLQVLEEDSGLHFILKIDTGLKDAELKERASNAGVELSFVQEFFSHGYGDGTKYEHLAIINFSGMKNDDIKKMINALECAWSGI